MNYFINLSVHNYKFWSLKQINESKIYGEIINCFPDEIESDMNTNDIYKLALNRVNNIIKKYKNNDNEITVLVEANHIYSYYVVNELKKNNIKALWPYSKRLERDYNPTSDIRMTEKKFVFEKYIEY